MFDSQASISSSTSLSQDNSMLSGVDVRGGEVNMGALLTGEVNSGALFTGEVNSGALFTGEVNSGALFTGEVNSVRSA